MLWCHLNPPLLSMMARKPTSPIHYHNAKITELESYSTKPTHNHTKLKFGACQLLDVISKQKKMPPPKGEGLKKSR